MEIFMIAFSTFLGAAVALAAERLTKQHDARLREQVGINNLILDLAAKRAFLVNEDWVWSDGEMRRVVESIFHARSLIRDTRILLRPQSKALPLLRNMTRACNTFLERSEREDPERLKAALRELSVDMSRQVEAVHELAPSRILPDKPGSFALSGSD